jgi:dTDP-glucose 4,6-dehydratase
VVLEKGRVGEVYNIGGRCEKSNLEIVTTVCSLLDNMLPDSSHVPHRDLLCFVKDRPGHDRRYAIDCSKITRELGWQPKETLETGLRSTLRWYLENADWVESVQTGSYREWICRHYGDSGRA